MAQRGILNLFTNPHADLELDFSLPSPLHKQKNTASAVFFAYGGERGIRTLVCLRTN